RHARNARHGAERDPRRGVRHRPLLRAAEGGAHMTALPPGKEVRERVDTAQVLTRFHYLERALTIACAGWVPAAPLLEQKAALSRISWQCALAADALRERVFELRYPSRLLEAGADEPMIGVYEAAIRAPDPDSFVRGLSEVLFPSLLGEYWAFLEATDALDDGPTIRILEAAARDKGEQMSALAADTGDSAWPDELRRSLDTLEPPAGTPFAIAEDPARDDRYAVSSFYWPDTLDPSYP